MKRWQMAAGALVVLFFGSVVGGCFAVWLFAAPARADGPVAGTTMTVPCSTPGTVNSNQYTFAVVSLPGMSAEDIEAGAWIVGQPLTASVGGVAYSYPRLEPVRSISAGTDRLALFADGSLAVTCADGTSSVTLFVR
jgi:hypothetical protein